MQFTSTMERALCTRIVWWRFPAASTHVCCKPRYRTATSINVVSDTVTSEGPMQDKLAFGGLS
jgi:hypothetical protein